MADAIRTLSIFGTRPEAIKMAPVLMQLSDSSSIESIRLHHRPTSRDAGPGT